MSPRWQVFTAGSGAAMNLTRQIDDYATRVNDLRARQNLVRDSRGFFDDLYEEVSQGIEELRIAEEELRHRDNEIYRAYAALVHERRRYKDLFELGPDAHLITDAGGVILEANRRAVQVLGCPVQFLRGKPTIAFVSGSGERRRFRTWFDNASPARTAQPVNVVLYSRYREPFAAELRVAGLAGEGPGLGELLWTIVDLSEKLAARRDADLAAVVRVTGDAILIVSMEGTVAEQNPASERLYGALVGRSVLDIVGPECRSDHARTVAGLSAAARVATIDAVHLREGGAAVDVSVTYSLIDEPAGSPRRVALVIRDISARKRLEAQLAQRATEGETADRRKTEFIGLLAHELRNPLSVIVSAMQVLARTEDPAAREQVPATCLRNARHMARLIEELLDLSRISRDDLPVDPRSAVLQEIVARAVELASPSLQERKHELKVELPEQALVLRVDPTRLTQAITNLLDNAAKYTPEGGTIAVSVQVAGDRGVSIRVQDNGVGIPPELADRIFDPFVQGGNHRTASGGLGLGLALVRRIAEAHGGTVSVESAGSGRGTCFTLSLPASARLGLSPELVSPSLDDVAERQR